MIGLVVVLSVKRFRRSAGQWQHRRIAGTRQRWDLIADALAPTDRTLLDIGCNAGMLTAEAADHGLLALGIDQAAPTIDAARRAHPDRADLAFMVHTIDAENVRRLPSFDVVLFLSVYHQWVEAFGTGQAERMLGDLVGRAHHLVFFETAGVARKYGEHVPPQLVDGGVVDFVEDLLGRVAPAGSRIGHLGATPTPDADEVERHLFAVEVGPDPA